MHFGDRTFGGIPDMSLTVAFRVKNNILIAGWGSVLVKVPKTGTGQAVGMVETLISQKH